MNRKLVYHTLFWVFVFFLVLDYLVYEYQFITAIYHTFIEVFIYIFIFYINFYVLIPKLLKKGNLIPYILGLFGFLVVIYIPYYFSEIGYYLIDDNELRIAISFTLNYVLFIIVSYLYWYLTLYQKEKQKSILLENEKLQAELQLLKSQVSPHFLFNSLNNIYSLSVAKNENASVMIEKLSDILRYIIYESAQEKVLLTREIELVENYMDLQLLKKPKAIKNIDMVVSEIPNGQKIAPLLLINLIENCFKHSDVVFNPEGFLSIKIDVSENALLFSTKNSYQERPKKNGIGLANIKEQLKHYYPNKHQLHIEDNNGTFKVELTINL